MSNLLPASTGLGAEQGYSLQRRAFLQEGAATGSPQQGVLATAMMREHWGRIPITSVHTLDDA